MNDVIIFYLFLAILNFFLATLSKDEFRFVNFIAGCACLIRVVNGF